MSIFEAIALMKVKRLLINSSVDFMKVKSIEEFKSLCESKCKETYEILKKYPHLIENLK